MTSEATYSLTTTAERGQHLGIQPDGPAADPDSPALTGRDQAYTSWPDSILFGFGRTQ